MHTCVISIVGHQLGAAMVCGVQVGVTNVMVGSQILVTLEGTTNVPSLDGVPPKELEARLLSSGSDMGEANVVTINRFDLRNLTTNGLRHSFDLLGDGVQREGKDRGVSMKDPTRKRSPDDLQGTKTDITPNADQRQ